MKISGFKDTIRWYDKNAEKYAQSIQPFISIDLIEEFLSYLPKNSIILDAGCAAGRDSKVFFDKGYQAIGVDISENLIKIAKKKYPKIQFVQADFRHLPLKNESIDGVWAHASLLHFETKKDVFLALKEFYRVLKKDGIIYVSVKKKLNKKTEIVKDKISHHHRFFQFFTKEEVKNLMIKSGFKIIRIKYDQDLAKRKGVNWITAFARSRLLLPVHHRLFCCRKNQAHPAVFFVYPLNKGFNFLTNFYLFFSG